MATDREVLIQVERDLRTMSFALTLGEADDAAGAGYAIADFIKTHLATHPDIMPLYETVHRKLMDLQEKVDA